MIPDENAHPAEKGREIAITRLPLSLISGHRFCGAGRPEAWLARDRSP